ncbi:unnamed protein product [Phytophthora lilii]|uniref:Unnamed protein product n=1 Tax=Phytophthora lilii TaxID=2077276 RepID=A0A9W6TGT0_9STRA|nr:unnamed protein product [Phytophthora lilii]
MEYNTDIATSDTKQDFSDNSDGDESVGSPPEKVGLKRVAPRSIDQSTARKRLRFEHSESNKMYHDHTERADLVDAESDVRRELLRLEVQVKRDEAICVRVKARSELLALGVSSTVVDRLLPL